MVIAALFDWTRIINQLHDGSQKISSEDLARLKMLVNLIVFEVLGLRDEKSSDAVGTADRLGPVVELLLEMRAEAKAAKDWALSDRIRDRLATAGIRVKDRKDAPSEWEIE
jgi:cysteinyl-tRNA synthetase